MMSKIEALNHIEKDSLKENPPQFDVGDVIQVDVRIREGERERIQMFEGTVIAKQGGGISETFTVRRLSYGVGVERVFPLHSPNVNDVRVVRRGKVRRSKLYYLRGRQGRAAKVKERIGSTAVMGKVVKAETSKEKVAENKEAKE